jgi:hypothetical protein
MVDRSRFLGSLDDDAALPPQLLSPAELKHIGEERLELENFFSLKKVVIDVFFDGRRIRPGVIGLNFGMGIIAFLRNVLGSEPVDVDSEVLHYRGDILHTESNHPPIVIFLTREPNPLRRAVLLPIHRHVGQLDGIQIDVILFPEIMWDTTIQMLLRVKDVVLGSAALQHLFG